jgi:hypothetical protein
MAFFPGQPTVRGSQYRKVGLCLSIAIMRNVRCSPNAEQGSRAKSVRFLWTTPIQTDELRKEIALNAERL